MNAFPSQVQITRLLHHTFIPLGTRQSLPMPAHMNYRLADTLVSGGSSPSGGGGGGSSIGDLSPYSPYYTTTFPPSPVMQAWNSILGSRLSLAQCDAFDLRCYRAFENWRC